MTNIGAEEIFDIVDEKDNVIGRASRSECHSNPNLIHHTVQFTLINKKDNTVLLTQRSYKKEHDAGKLCFMGEHILSRESNIDGITRGVIEELGFKPSKFKECAKNIFKYDKQTEFIRFYAVYYNNEQIIWDKDEFENIFWIKERDLKNNISNYSEMTAYWVENVDWSDVFGMSIEKIS